MYIVLQVQTGASAGRQCRLTAGKQICVGRSSQSDLPLPRDSFISGQHFLLENDEGSCWITDLNSRNGTFVNGHRVERACLNSGDTIMAGHTVFAVQLRPDATDSPEVVSHLSAVDHQDDDFFPITSDVNSYEMASPIREARLLQLFREEFQPLYIVLDIFADKKLLRRVYNEPHFETLVDNRESVTSVGQVSLHLVRLSSDSPLLEMLIHEGWGHKWGVYLTYHGQLQDLPSHLHHLLGIRTKDGGEFRYYSPPVLRRYLQNCTAEEALRCFGPIQHFLLEGDRPDQLLQFTRTESGARRAIIPLDDPANASEKSSQTL
jgi:hypothetical protein